MTLVLNLFIYLNTLTFQRSYIHSIGYMENKPWSWENFKQFSQMVEEDDRERKWERMAEIDVKRTQRLSRGISFLFRVSLKL